MLNGLPVARIEVLLLPVASLVRLPDPTPSLPPHYGPSWPARGGPAQCPAARRWPRGFVLPLGLLPWHQSDWFLQFRATACIRFTPPLRRSPSAPSSGTQRTCPRGTIRSWFRRHLSS